MHKNVTTRWFPNPDDGRFTMLVRPLGECASCKQDLNSKSFPIRQSSHAHLSSRSQCGTQILLNEESFSYHRHESIPWSLHSRRAPCPCFFGGTLQVKGLPIFIFPVSLLPFILSEFFKAVTCYSSHYLWFWLSSSLRHHEHTSCVERYRLLSL